MAEPKKTTTKKTVVKKSEPKKVQNMNAEAAVSKSAKASTSSLKLDVYSMAGSVVGTVSLPESLFNTKINKSLLAQAVRVYQANLRSGNASTKTRGEVEGSTRKIYRQKGTGRARHGGIRAPIFVGGGIVFGPKPRDFSRVLPQKMRRAALASALTVKMQDGKIMVTDGLIDGAGKTKGMFGMLKALNLLNKQKKAQKILFVMPEKVEPVSRAMKNIEGVDVEVVKNLNAYSVLKNRYVVFMKNAVDVLHGEKAEGK